MAISAAAVHQFQSPKLHSASFVIHNTELPGCNQESLPTAPQGLHPTLAPHSHANKPASLHDLHLDSPKPYPRLGAPPLGHHFAASSLPGSPTCRLFGAHLYVWSAFSPRTPESHTVNPTDACETCVLPCDSVVGCG